MTLTDLSPRMLVMSRSINPECEHVRGDMRTLRLGRTFDAVFVHDAICYITTERDLARVFKTAFVHLRPGGAVLFAPDCTRETFGTTTEHGGHDGPDGRALRYLMWTHDADPNGTTYVVDFTYILRSASGTVRVEHDRHIDGVFPRATWLRLLRAAGLRPRRIVHHDPDAGPLDVFVAVRPA